MHSNRREGFNVSLKNKEKIKLSLQEQRMKGLKARGNLFLVLIMMFQLILPAMIAADSSTNNDAIEPNVVEVQSQEETTDADIESPESSEVPVEEDEEEATEIEEETSSGDEENEKPADEKPVEKPVEKEKGAQTENKTKDEIKEEPKAEPKVEVKEETESLEEEDDLISNLPDPMLDGFPATPHPANVTPLTLFAAGSLGSALAAQKAGRAMTAQATDLAPGEVRTSKTATPVPGMVNTWDVTVRIEGRDNNVVKTTDIVLVLDRSGSMEGTRLANLKTAGENFIDQTIPFDPNLRIAIVSFSSDYQGAPLYRIDHQFSKNTTTLKTALNSLVALGGTHTQAGILQGRQLLNGSTSDNKYMILLSDGEPTFSYRPSNWTTTNPGGWPDLNISNSRTNYFGLYDGNFNSSNVVGTGNDLTQSFNEGNNARLHINNGAAAIRAGQDARNGITKLYTIGIQVNTTTAAILANIASPGAAYRADRPEDLPGLYEEVRTQIMTQSALRDVTIRDEMGDGFSLISNTVTTTEGTTAVTDATSTVNDTINWTISPHVNQLVPGTTDVRYAEMTYRVEINPSILNAPVATAGTTADHDLFRTNKVTELRYTDINNANQTKQITSPQVDPVLLKIKKNLLDAAPNEGRRFNVRITRDGGNFNQLVELIPNGDYLWLTTLRHEGTYSVQEVSVTGNPTTPLNQFIISYNVDGTTGTAFNVNHDGAIPRGDIDIEVTNREIKKISVTGTKVWEGGPQIKPNVTLQLYRNGVAHGTPVTLIHPVTTYTWTNLDDIDSNGVAYSYTIEEVNPPAGYQSTANGLTVTNIYQIPDDGVATAIKIWQGSNPDEFSEVPLTLWRTLDGVSFEQVPNVSPTITQDPIVNPNERIYRYVWDELVETDFYGNPYTFYFTEDATIDGYERDYLDTTTTGLVNDVLIAFALSGGRVRNREMLIDFSFNKVNEVGDALAGAVFDLHRHDGQNRILVERLGAGTPISTFNFTGLTKGTYTLTEVSAPDGYALPEDRTWTFEVVWNDTDKKLEIVYEAGDEIDGEIENHPKGMLPDTGGPGNSAYLITSLVSLLSLMLIYIWRKKEDGGLNMTKKISIFLMLFLSMASFGALNSNTAEAAIGEDTTIILHKLLFDFDKMPESITNNGNENPAYDDYVTLPGAEFEVYDVTSEFINHAEEGLATSDIQRELALVDVTDRTPITSGTTNMNGEVRFTLPSNDGVTAYLFHESRVPNGIRERTANMVVILPFFNKENELLSTIHLYPKNESETIPFEKDLMGEISYGIGERILFEIRSKVPKNPQDYEIFRISDLADDELQFYPDSLEVIIGDAVISPGEVYSLETLANGFRLDFNPEYLMEYRDENILVRYEMALSEDAIPDTNYLNEGVLEYDNHLLIDREIVRTGGYHFVKVDIRDETRTLADAHFVLKNSDNNYLVNADGIYRWVANKDEATVFISDADGLIQVRGLKYGRYFLEEIKAPLRYVLSTTPIAFDVMNGTYNLNAAMNIVNQPERPRLPITGGTPTPSTPVTPSRPRLPVTRGEEPVERPRLPRTGETVNRLIMGAGVLFITMAVIIQINEHGKRRKENEKGN